MAQQKAPNCFNCKHYYVTWDKKFPHGCRHLGFKCKMIPSREVFLASGIQCVLFDSKTGPKSDGQNSSGPIRPNSSFTREA